MKSCLAKCLKTSTHTQGEGYYDIKIAGKPRIYIQQVLLTTFAGTAHQLEYQLPYRHIILVNSIVHQTKVKAGCNIETLLSYAINYQVVNAHD
jgi:hypothetical protein